MRGKPGTDVVDGVPEQPVVVRRTIALCVVHVDVGDVRGQRAQEAPPAVVTATEELVDEPGERIVLVVVVRDQGLGTRIAHRLVIGVQIAEVTPAVLIHALALQLECVWPLNRSIHESHVVGMRILGSGNEV